jgi:hypothetical protein
VVGQAGQNVPVGPVYLLVLGFFAVFLVLAVFSMRYVRLGAVIAGGAMIAAGVARGVLPERFAGGLVSRRRYLDCATLAAIGASIVAFALILPPA